jgi:hypothetical protein
MESNEAGSPRKDAPSRNALGGVAETNHLNNSDLMIIGTTLVTSMTLPMST